MALQRLILNDQSHTGTGGSFKTLNSASLAGKPSLCKSMLKVHRVHIKLPGARKTPELGYK